MKSLIFSLYQHPITKSIANHFKIPLGEFTLRQFPDTETYLKIDSDVKNKNIILIDSLDRPNQKILPLIFFAETVKSLGAKEVGIVAPYLAYMRQDTQFQPGEGITSRYFAQLLSQHFDWLFTIDPHLHRYHQLSEIYNIPTQVIHASPLICQWISKHVNKPLLIGPDVESKQWVEEMANEIKAPYLVLKKIRHGDKSVEVNVPNVSEYQSHTPILIDDIISTGETMHETILHLKDANMHPPICIGIHAVFADNAYQKLLESPIEKIITCNTMTHPSNEIDLAPLLLNALDSKL